MCVYLDANGRGKSRIAYNDCLTGDENIYLSNVQTEDENELITILTHEIAHIIFHKERVFGDVGRDTEKKYQLGFDELIKQRYRVALMKIALEENKRFFNL